jgi:hypothetical protein
MPPANVQVVGATADNPSEPTADGRLLSLICPSAQRPE